MGGNCLFSTMDLTSGFYNIPIYDEDRKYTAVSTPVGLFEYNRMAQGLCNSPAMFSRMMMSIFGVQNYLDDLLVFGKSEQEALEWLELVFSGLSNNNLKLAQKKCHFLRCSVKFLGHVISQKGIQTDEGKVTAISEMTSTYLMEMDGKNPGLKRVQSFLGMMNYYSYFINMFSKIVKPLCCLTAGHKTKRKDKNGKTE